MKTVWRLTKQLLNDVACILLGILIAYMIFVFWHLASIALGV